eukprot:g1009.t1
MSSTSSDDPIARFETWIQQPIIKKNTNNVIVNEMAEVKCVFDGSCELSSDGDVTLKFDDDSSLLAHSLLLKKASPVLRTILTECQESDVIKLDSVSRDVWIDILSELYPMQHSTLLTKIFRDDFTRIVEIGKECMKYGILGVLETIDEIVYQRVNALAVSNPPTWNNTLGSCAKMASVLTLKKSRDIISNRIITAMCTLNQTKIGYRDPHGYGRSSPQANIYPSQMLVAIRDLYDGGDHGWNTWFSRELLYTVFAIDVRQKSTDK